MGHVAGTAVPGCVLAPASPPIGLTAAGLFAGGEVSRPDSRVRSPASFPGAGCPAVRSGLDAGPEVYHNPAAAWWGLLQLPGSSGTRWPSPNRPQALLCNDGRGGGGLPAAWPRLR